MESLLFQIIDISSDDIPIDENNYWNKEFIITFYGKTNNGKNVVCSIQGFKPYFYLRIPDNWGNTTIRSFLKVTRNFIQSWVSDQRKKSAWKGNYEEDFEAKQSYNFYGFNYDHECEKIKKYRFVKLSFQSYGDMKKCIGAIQEFYKVNQEYILKDKIVMGKDTKGKMIIKDCDPKTKSFFIQEHNCDCVANLYESKIHPMLRFLHEKDIQPCGWISVKAKDYYIVSDDQKKFNVDI